MKTNLHSKCDSFDELLRNALENYEPEVPNGLWGKMSTSLFKKDLADFVTFRKLKQSFRPEMKAAGAQVKIWLSYAAAACFTIGLAFGTGYFINNAIKNNKQNHNKNNNTINAPAEETNITTTTNTPAILDNTEISPKITHNKPQITQKQNPAIQNYNTTNTQLSEEITNTTTPTPNETDKNKQTDYQTSLLQYIEKVNSPEKQTPPDIETPEEIAISDFDFNTFDNNSAEENETELYPIEIPNVFTPNGDGYNDYFIIKNIDKYPDNSLIIANRNGVTVFETLNYQNNWDARNLPAGTYYYIFTYKDKRKNQGVIKGIVSVVR